jgi:hypothetical protein
MTLPTQFSEPWAAGPDDPYTIEPCPECGAPDAEYGLHEPDCPSGYPTRDPEKAAFQEAVREYENDNPGWPF